MDFTLKSLFGISFGLQDLDLLETVGSNVLGRTRLVRSLSDRTFYSLKIMKKSRIVRLKQLEHVQNEIKILSHFRCRFVTELKAVFQDDNSVYLMSEYISGGEIFTHLRRRQRFDHETCQFYIVEISCALDMLHKANIVYRDLKPENILLNKNGHIRLVDFSLAKIVPNRTYTLCGTPEYLSPELILGGGYGFSTDWWALGILLYEMAVGYPPFFGRNPFSVYRKILEGNVKFYGSGLSKSVKSLITALLVSDRKMRLGCSVNGINDFKNHTFFRGIDWISAAQELIVPPLTPVFSNGGGSSSSDGDTSNYDYYPEETVEEPNNLTNEERHMFLAIDYILERASSSSG